MASYLVLLLNYTNYSIPEENLVLMATDQNKLTSTQMQNKSRDLFSEGFSFVEFMYLL